MIRSRYESFTLVAKRWEKDCFIGLWWSAFQSYSNELLHSFGYNSSYPQSFVPVDGGTGFIELGGVLVQRIYGVSKCVLIYMSK